MICKHCGKEFTKTKNNQRYCSPECKANAAYEQSQNSYLKHRDKVKAQQQAVAAVKSGWLTIPDAPNYEISADLQVRNKRTGQFLHTYKISPTRKCKYYNLWVEGRRIFRTGKSLRNQAEAAALAEIGDEWYPVPSLNNRYEFNNKNFLRVTATKHLMHLYPKNLYHVRTATGKQWISITNLRWEVFGEIPPFGSRIKKPVIISKDRTTLHFDCHKYAAQFIANEQFYSWYSVVKFFRRRQTQIFGWTINYLENEITQVGEYLKGMQTKDPRQAKTK